MRGSYEFHVYWNREAGGGRIRQRARALRQFLEDQTGYRFTIQPGGRGGKMPTLMPFLDAGFEMRPATRRKRTLPSPPCNRIHFEDRGLAFRDARTGKDVVLSLGE
mgnify:CR=1 FL=1